MRRRRSCICGSNQSRKSVTCSSSDSIRFGVVEPSLLRHHRYQTRHPEHISQADRTGQALGKFEIRELVEQARNRFGIDLHLSRTAITAVEVELGGHSSSAIPTGDLGTHQSFELGRLLAKIRSHLDVKAPMVHRAHDHRRRKPIGQAPLCTPETGHTRYGH